MQKQVKYYLYREGEYWVARCLNIELSSFGSSVAEAEANIREAIELYFEDEREPQFEEVGEVILRSQAIYA